MAADPLPPCLCGCGVVTDRKAFWLLLMLTADGSLNLPCWWCCSTSSIDLWCGIFLTNADPPPLLGSFFFFLPAFLTALSLPLSSGVEKPLAALPSATAALGVGLRHIRSAASHQGQAAGARPPHAGQFQWAERLKVGGKKPGKKERTVGRWNRSGGREWDADFKSKWASFDFFFFLWLKRKKTNPGCGQLSFKQNHWNCLKLKAKYSAVAEGSLRCHRNPELFELLIKPELWFKR